MRRLFLIFTLILGSLVLLACGETTNSSDASAPDISNCSIAESPQNKAELKAAVDKFYVECQNEADYSLIDVSAITNMSGLFKGNTNFNGDISSWDMSGVLNVNSMFEGATAFDQDLSGWKLNAQAVVKDSAAPTKMFYKSGMRPKMLPTMNFYQYTPTTKAALKAAIDAEIATSVQGAEADLSIIDTSQVTNMSQLFKDNKTFNGYVATWDMTGVSNVSSMFEGATNFNQDLSSWVLNPAVVSGSATLTKMFYKSGMQPGNFPRENFYQHTPTTKGELQTIISNEIIKQGAEADLSIIDTSQVTDMSGLFKDNKTFNGYVATWDMTGVSNVSSMFEGATAFDQDLSGWKLNTAAVVRGSEKPTKMFYKSGMQPGNFPGENFYQYTPANNADLKAAVNAEITAQGAEADLSIIDTSQVTDMSELFKDKTTFNGYVSTWDMSGVTTITSMFEGATNFNQDLSGWKLKAGVITKGSNLPTKMFYKSGMQPGNFPGENFYQYTPTTKGELQTAITTEITAQGAEADLSIIDTSGVTDMSELFKDKTTFNGYVSTWDMSGVTTITSMFEGATNFNQDLAGWKLNAQAVVKDSAAPTKMFYKSGMQPGNLPGENFYQYTPANNADLKAAVNAEITAQGAEADLSIIDTSGVTDMSEVFKDKTTFNGYVSTWDMSGVTTVTSMFEGATAFDQDLTGWKLKAGVIAKGSNSPTKMFYKSGMRPKMLPLMNFYQYSPITKTRLIIDFDTEITAQGDEPDLSIIDTSRVSDMGSVFFSRKTFNGYIATWDTSSVQSMRSMFASATNFNQPIGNWDTGNVIEMSYMFHGATAFNQPIGNWNTSKVTKMFATFYQATSFNQPIGGWDVTNVVMMRRLFSSARAFNQPIGNWDTDNVTDMAFMFDSATVFNQPIGNWNTSKVTDMESMFLNAFVFDQPIGKWDTSKVEDMKFMFGNAAKFFQDLTKWVQWKDPTDPTKTVVTTGMFNGSKMRDTTTNKATWMP